MSNLPIYASFRQRARENHMGNTCILCVFNEIAMRQRGSIVMKHETKFSVIVPCEQFTSEQAEVFETVAQRYGLSIDLPLRSDGHGNFIAARGLNLRDAQGLRRQISSLGYPADVVNVASEATRVGSSTPDTLVVDAVDVDFDTQDPVSEITADAWSSLEMPSLDLGLFDGSETDVESPSGSSKLKDDGTLSVSATDLFKAAEASKGKCHAPHPIDALGFKNLMGQRKKSDESGVPILDASSIALRGDGPGGACALPSVPRPSTSDVRQQSKITQSGMSLSNANRKSSIEYPSGDMPSLDIDESSLCALSQQVSELSKNERADARNDTQATSSENAKQNAASNAVENAESKEGMQEVQVKSAQNDVSSTLPPSDLAKRNAPSSLSMGGRRRHPVVACVLVAILAFLALVIIDLGSTPISFLDVFLTPLF